MSEAKRNKGTSVAAFMFMPQFHLCFRGAAHIVPIFMRTLALMFVQAGLIDRNHPATRYGIEGVKKYSFADLMGEAWFSLRNQRADARQWGLFISVIMMIAVTIAAIGTFFLNILFGLGTAAQAQIFSHPASPYGGDNQTTIEKMQSAIGGTAPPMFDKRTAYDTTVAGDASRGSLDLGLMILDKVLRQSTVGNGGALQTGLAGLMQVYNTGILVVAAVMIFWMILSIVVDTAKTGIVGGGRHNMVWTPIRVVFALGIMIPLGTTGFSSGQFAVMKLAEWGSNFGTRAWNGYVTGVINSSSLLSPFSPKSASALADGLARIKTCQVAWNAEAAKQATLDPLYSVQRQAPSLDSRTGMVRVNYTNSTEASLCGGIEYSALSGEVGASWLDTLVAAAPSVTGTSLMQAANDFREAMKQALANDLNDSNGTGGNGALIEQARMFACGFVGRRMWPNDSSTNPVMQSGQCSAATGCGSSQTNDPTLQCHQQMVSIARGRLDSTYSSAVSELTDYIGGPMIAEMTNKGWAGMGNWPYYISVLNGLAQGAREVSVTILPGTMWSAPASNPETEIPEIERVVRTINADYDRWWSQQSDDTSSSQVAAAANRRDSVATTATINRSQFNSFLERNSNPSGFADNVLNRVMPDEDAFFFFDLVEPGKENVYPFAELVTTGRQIMAMFLGIITILTVLQAISTASGFGFSAGSGFADSALVNGITAVSNMGVVAGMVLSFYVPVLPLLRTTFAALTWIISVFEAVAMVPLAALNFLTSVGEGMGARETWILWLNVLLRPVLVVLGFVASMLIFNTFAVYFHTNFSHGISGLRTDMNIFTRLLSYVAYTVIYVGAVYTAANSTFKLLDLMPDAMMRWMGGRADVSFDDNSSAGMLYAASNLASSFKKTPRGKKEGDGDKKQDYKQA